MNIYRSAIPVVTSLLAISIEKKVPTKFEGFSLLVLTIGVMVAVWEGAAGTSKGVIICTAGQSVCQSVDTNFQPPRADQMSDPASQKNLKTIKKGGHQPQLC